MTIASAWRFSSVERTKREVVETTSPPGATTSTFVSVITRTAVASCLADDVDCYAECACDASYAGSASCGVTLAALAVKLQYREALLSIGKPVPRCVVTTQDPGTGERDFPTLVAIKRARAIPDGAKLPFGVYARVLEPGTVRVGDRLEVVA